MSNILVLFVDLPDYYHFDPVLPLLLTNLHAASQDMGLDYQRQVLAAKCYRNRLDSHIDCDDLQVSQRLIKRGALCKRFASTGQMTQTLLIN